MQQAANHRCRHQDKFLSIGCIYFNGVKVRILLFLFGAFRLYYVSVRATAAPYLRLGAEMGMETSKLITMMCRDRELIRVWVCSEHSRI